jgi:hypothetical protein
MKGQHIFAGAILAIGTWVALSTEPRPLGIPPNWRPWGEIELDQQPTILARFQLRRLASDRGACFAALDRSSLEYTEMPDRPLERGCGIEARTHILRSHYAYSSGFEAPCGLIAALYWYEHYGTYACRNIYNRAESRLSAHARANAIDIAGFRLDDGSSVSVLRDWGKDTARARFLTEARDEACRFFGIVLSPAYNEAHANHFHLEIGGFGLCR